MGEANCRSAQKSGGLKRGAIDERSLVVYEHSSREPAPVDPAFSVQREASYGEVALAFLQPEPA